MKYIFIRAFVITFVLVFVNCCIVTRVGIFRNKSDKPSEFIVDQLIGILSVPAKLKFGLHGLEYRNKNMKKSFFIPWTAVIKCKSRYLGHGRTGTISENYDYYYICFYLDNDLIPEKKKDPALEKGQLYFRTCCTKTYGKMIIKYVKKYCPKAEQ